MRFWLFSLLAGVLLQPAAAQVAPASKDTIATRVQLPGADCALFPAAAFTHCPEHTLPSTGRFTPTRQQAVAAEKALVTVRLQDLYEWPVTSYYAKHPAIIKENLPKYQRQYYGFYNAKHQPCLFINFFMERYEEVPGRPAIWLLRPICAYDGGAAFWRIYYNVTTNKFYSFSHNSKG